MRRKEFAAAVVLIVGSIAYGYLAWGLPVRSLPNTPGPPFFPLVVAVVLLALSVALLIQASTSEPEDDAQPTADAAVARKNRGLALWLLGVFAAYVVLLPTLGFIVATIPFFAGLMVLFGERRLAVVAAGAVLMTAALYMLFRHGFGVFLPPGVLRGIIA